jgi:hypothetical protein
MADKPQRMRLRIEDLTFDPRLQLRVTMNSADVTEYSRKGKKFPPITVVLDEDGRYLVADGWYRSHGRKEAGELSIDALVTKGTFADAMLAAAVGNGKHGIPWTHEDKWRVVVGLLSCAEWAGKADRWIAAETGFAHSFIAKVRKQEAEQAKNEHSDDRQPDLESSSGGPRRTGRDGKSRPVESKRGQKPKLLCSRCKRVGYVKDCIHCLELNKPPEQTTKSDTLLDGNDKEVPSRLRDLFGDPWLKKILARASESLLPFEGSEWRSALKNKTTRYAGWMDAGRVLVSLEAAETHIKRFVELIEQAIPYAVCPKCEGKKCPACNNSGWLPLAAWEEMGE